MVLATPCSENSFSAASKRLFRVASASSLVFRAMVCAVKNAVVVGGWFMSVL